MSFVQCLDCGGAVVVDPAGMCPEGHLVGSAGARIERSMGASEPHPDEPEPWVARVQLDAAETEPAAVERAVRPVRIVHNEHTPGLETDTVDHEAMMRELHALGDLDLSSSSDTPRPSAPPPGDAAPAPTATPSASTDSLGEPSPARAPAITRDEMAEGFAELTALEAAVQAMGFEESSAPEPADSATGGTPTGREATASDDLAAFETLLDAASPSAAPAPAAAPLHSVPTIPDPARADDPAHAGGTETGAPLAPPAAAPVAPPAATPVAPPAARATPDAPTDEPSGQPDTHLASESPAAEPSRRQPAADLDITNFTARGGKVGAGRSGGRRKLFGR